MHKDLKIAITVIAVILMIALFEDANPIRYFYSDNLNKPYYAQNNQSKYVDKEPIKTQHQSTSQKKSCTHNGIELKGKVQFVDSFPDLKIKYVSSFADIHVEFVSSFPDDCGQWQEVSSFPDFKVQVVDSFPDIEVKKVSSFPGMQ